MKETIRAAKILIVDDNEENIAVIEQMLRKAGYPALHSTSDSRKALAMVEELRPDMLILDLLMPPPDGFAILDALTLSPTRDKQMPILVLTGDATPATRVKALSMGAREFLTKPVDRVDLLIRTRVLLEWRFALKEAMAERAWRAAEQQARGSAGSDGEMLDRLAVISACLAPEKAREGDRIAELAERLALELKLEPGFCTRLRSAARLFDFGLLALPEAIRNARAPLCAEDRLAFVRHTLAAKQMFGGSTNPGLEMAREIGMGHHERWDGAGYPLGTSGAETPLAARIVAVASAYVWLTSENPVRAALRPEEAIAEVERQAGYAFDPELVSAFARALAATQPVG